MTSKIQICNDALNHLGEDQIESLSDNVILEKIYDMTRKEVLSSYNWDFANVLKTLAQVSVDENLTNYNYVFQLPTDPEVLSIRTLNETSSKKTLKNYRRIQDRIYCGESAVFLSYTTDITDTTKYSPKFIELFSWALAVKGAFPITKDKTITQLTRQQYGIAFRQATGSALRERGDNFKVNVNLGTFNSSRTE